MKELSKNDKPIAIALGYFDCVHYAHRKIISEAALEAKREGLKSAVLTFSNGLFSKGSLPVYTFKERKKLICEQGADFILPFNFDETFKGLSPKSFLDMLFSDYNIKVVVCGSDYRFGKGGEGDVELLKAYAESRGAGVKIFQPITMGGQTVSSSLIKQELAAGNVKKVNELLCAPYFFEGKVSRGKGRGQVMGYPTANLKPTERFIPKFGVYKSRTVLDGKMYDSLTSIGNKPTFDDDCITVETFIKGDIFNLYNKIIRVELFDFIRELTKFAGVSQLKAQIKKDIEEGFN